MRNFFKSGGHRPVIFPALYPFPRKWRVQNSRLPCPVSISERVERQSNPLPCPVPISEGEMGIGQVFALPSTLFRGSRGYEPVICLVLYPFPRKWRVQSSHLSCPVPFSEGEEGTEQSFAMSSAHFRESGGYRPVICLVMYPFQREWRVQTSHLPCPVPFSERAEGTDQPFALSCTHSERAEGTDTCIFLHSAHSTTENTRYYFISDSSS